jgi:hypothetical protein
VELGRFVFGLNLRGRGGHCVFHELRARAIAFDVRDIDRGLIVVGGDGWRLKMSDETCRRER